MVYIQSDGTVVDRRGFSVSAWFWGVVNFFSLLGRTLFNLGLSKHGDKYERVLRPPSSGPANPPSRKFGGFGPSSGSAPPPPPAGGCGCGG